MDAIADAAEAFVHQLGNENFDGRLNGEHRVLELLGAIKPRVIFDVGANEGEWSRTISNLYPHCAVHAFEVVPSTAERLGRSLSDRPAVVVRPFGLSDVAGPVDIHVPDENAASSMATAFPARGIRDFYKCVLRCQVRRADEYIREQGIEAIDFVKIDVEGMDLRVIKGFGDALRNARVVQFEYGAFNVASHDLLVDFCAHLERHGFVIGKIYPRVVKFFDYAFKDDNLYGTNFLAVRRDQEEFIHILARYGSRGSPR